MMRPPTPVRLFLLAAPLFGFSGSLSGQTGIGPGADALYLPAEHWSADALRRLDPLVEAGATLPWGSRTVSRRDVLAVLDRIASAGDGGISPGVRALAAAYRDRFLEEFGEDDSPERRPGFRWARGHGEALLGQSDGALRPGAGRDDPTFPVPWDGPTEVQGSAGAAAAVGPLGLAASVRTDEEGSPGLSELYGAASVWALDLWAGRRAPGLGGGVGGTVILTGRVPLDGGGFALTRPLTLPWILKHLGPFRFESHLARLDESGEIGNPWLWTARGTLSPHPRISVGINRGAMFGGEGSPPMTFRNVFHTLLGSRTETGRPNQPKSAFANQIAALELRYRVPVEAVPLSVYVEWGMEDSAGSWWNVPGIVAGIHVPFLPGHPGLSLGLERAHFAPACCGNPPWYRHAHFTGGWSDEGATLGHPLGGNGDEWLLHGRADLMDARLRSGWRVFHRERGQENLFFPDRRGTSAGGALEARWRVRTGVDLVLDGFYERSLTGREWDEFRAFVGVRAFF